jgi:hypothetical protein
MNFENTLEQAVSAARRHHAWLVPATLLMLSHLVFSAGGVFAVLVSIPLCYAALYYYARQHPVPSINS